MRSISQEKKNELIAMRDRCVELLAPFHKKDRIFVKDALSNWDSTSDKEIVDEIVDQTKISVETANDIVQCRPYFVLYTVEDALENGYIDEDFA